MLTWRRAIVVILNDKSLHNDDCYCQQIRQCKLEKPRNYLFDAREQQLKGVSFVNVQFSILVRTSQLRACTVDAWLD